MISEQSRAAKEMKIDQGSYDSGSAPNAQVIMAPDARSQRVLAARSAKLEAEFRTAPLDLLVARILDIRSLHVALFDGLCPDMPLAVGTFRGQADTPLEHANRAVRTRGRVAGLRKIDTCLAPHEVSPEMIRFEAECAEFFDGPDPDLQILGTFTHRFFWIHPFIDGNGHLWRLVLIAMARHCRLQMCDSWQVSTRPYGPRFSLALQRFPKDPSLLENELGAFYIPLPHGP